MGFDCSNTPDVSGETSSIKCSEDDTVWNVEGTVIARNSFNAPLNESWTVTLRIKGDKWEIITAGLGDEIAYVSPKAGELLAEQEQKRQAEAATQSVPRDISGRKRDGRSAFRHIRRDGTP